MKSTLLLLLLVAANGSIISIGGLPLIAQAQVPEKVQAFLDFPWDCLPGDTTTTGTGLACYTSEGDRLWAFQFAAMDTLRPDSIRYDALEAWIRNDVGEDEVWMLPIGFMGLVKMEPFVRSVPDSAWMNWTNTKEQLENYQAIYAIKRALFGPPDTTSTSYSVTVTRVFPPPPDTLRVESVDRRVP